MPNISENYIYIIFTYAVCSPSNKFDHAPHFVDELFDDVEFQSI